jgi:hypothetical protein
VLQLAEQFPGMLKFFRYQLCLSDTEDMHRMPKQTSLPHACAACDVTISRVA